MTEYQPYFAAYVAAGGSTEMNARNNVAFIIWINEMWAAFRAGKTDVRSGSEAEAQIFGAWLAQQVAR